MKTTILTGLLALIVGVLIGYVAAPKGETGMHGAMQGMNASLEGKQGDEFDRAFLEAMILHHEGALSMAESALKSSAHGEIRELSKAIIASQSVEIAQMRVWLSGWYEAEPSHH